MSDQIWKYLSAVIVGAGAFAFLIYCFRSALSSVLLRASQVAITGPAGFKIVITGEAAADIATKVLVELERIISRHLTREEKQLFLILFVIRARRMSKTCYPTSTATMNSSLNGFEHYEASISFAPSQKTADGHLKPQSSSPAWARSSLNTGGICSNDEWA